MASKVPRWLMGCGVGCGVVVVLVLAAMTVGAVSFNRMLGDVDRATEMRAELEERFDTPESFTPAADGSVAPDRLERFLQVRQALEPLCSRFDNTFGRIEEFDDREEPPGMGEMFGLLGGALSFPRLMTDYVGARNQALLDAEMGLGEYTYIYVMAYTAGPAEDGQEERHLAKPLSRRIRRNVPGMLERQRALLAAEGERTQELALLDGEIEALRADDSRRPWQDGLPSPVADSLRAGQEELQRLACPLAADFALGRTERMGLTIRGD